MQGQNVHHFAAILLKRNKFTLWFSWRKNAKREKSGEAASCCVERASQLLAECAKKEKGEKMAKSQKTGKNDKVPENRKNDKVPKNFKVPKNLNSCKAMKN